MAKPARTLSLIDTRVIYCGDNLEQLSRMPDGCVDLIYIDPPFNSNRNYEVFWGETKEKRAFEDRHESTQAYIEFMRPRCVELGRVLKKTGSFYYHCDWHASHYVKVMLDQILGDNNFENEIVWKRYGAHSNSQGYGAVHDVILYYGGGEPLTFNREFEPYDPKYIEERFRFADADGRRWAEQNLNNPGVRPNLMYDFKAKNGITYKFPDNGWKFTRERMAALDAEGRLHYPKKQGGRLRLKNYLDEMPGVSISDVWTDISVIGGTSPERLGYPTQKPLSLLERIIRTSTKEHDIVLDAFCGCGTALVAAQNLKRQWIGIDVSPTACRVMAKRLRDVCGLKEGQSAWLAGQGFIVEGLPWSEAQLRKIPPFEFENWAVIALGGVKNKVQVGDMGIDGRIFPAGAVPQKRGKATGHLDFMDDWYPVQVKQKDKAGRPDIDAFEAMMARADRKKGFFVSFDYSNDAMTEIGAFFRKSGRVIIPLTVREILDEQIAHKLA
jgi:DNA modification methylase